MMSDYVWSMVNLVDCVGVVEAAVVVAAKVLGWWKRQWWWQRRWVSRSDTGNTREMAY